MLQIGWLSEFVGVLAFLEIVREARDVPDRGFDLPFGDSVIKVLQTGAGFVF